jgi:uncharacterized protein
MSTRDFVGAGWSFPTGVTSGGGIRLATGAAELDGAIRMILTTAPGERVMRPEFGCAMWEQAFAPLDANTMGMIEKAVREALLRWEPRIELKSVSTVAQSDRCAVVISISYVVRATNEQRNLVYPFYLIPSEEPLL